MAIPPKMSAPLEGPSSPRKPANPAGIVLAVIGGLAATCCIGGIVLAGVLFPFVRQMRMAARGSRCMSNLASINTAMSMYASDNDDHMPIADSWVDSLGSYQRYGGLFRCPEARATVHDAYGYAFNIAASGKAKSRLDPSLALVFDSTQFRKNASSGLETLPRPGRHLRRGRRTNNVLYLDGSVKPVD